jgi:NADPH:quinone reductase-like Zn-dependent oxidoreductase
MPRERRKVRIISYNAEASAGDFARLKRAAEACRLRVPIAAAYPLNQAAKAHEFVERGHVLGRVVLRIRREIV